MWRWNIKYFIVDAETGIKNRGESSVGSMQADPACKANKIVLLGERHKGVNHIFNPWDAGFGPELPNFLQIARAEPILLVGANISFDLKYLMKTYDHTYPQVINNIHIWDVQQVKYLMSGQTHMYPSLDEMSAEVGMPLKDDKIKEYWENGVDTEAIPDSELREYLAGDLTNTEAVFKYQYEIISKIPSLFNLVKVKMDDLLCTTMMEFNGMNFSLHDSFAFANENDKEIKLLRDDIESIARHHFQPFFPFNPMSNDHISLLLFGGTYTMREHVEVRDADFNLVVYKTGAKKGQVKTKLTDVSYAIHGIHGTPSWLKPNAKGIYPVGDDVLAKLAIHTANAVRRLRELVKENETYYRGYSALVWPDNKIHPTINHCSTRTGRQSCTKPNLQNATRDE